MLDVGAADADVLQHAVAESGQLLALAHQCLRAALIVPEVRGLSLAVERF